jgi:hypothetical protein
VGDEGCEFGTTDKEAHSGKRSVFFRITEFRSGGTVNNNALLIGESGGYAADKAFKVEPGKRYYFSFFLKGFGFLHPVPLSVLSWAKDLSPKGRQRSAASVGAVTVSEQWTCVQGFFDAGAETERAVLVLGGQLTKDKDVTAGAAFFVDDAYVGTSSVSYETYLRATRELTGNPASEGYALSPEVVRSLQRSFKPRDVEAKAVMIVGSGPAADPHFILPLLKEQPSGRSLVNGNPSLGMRLSILQAKGCIEADLKRFRPGIVAVMFDATDLAMGRKPADLTPALRDLLLGIQRSGAVPILYSLPTPSGGPKPQVAAIESLNAGICGLAEELALPLVDAKGVLAGGGPEDEKRLWATRDPLSARPSGLGYERLNQATAKLIRILDKHVVMRKTSAGRDKDGTAESE